MSVRDREALGGSIYALLAARGHPVSHGDAVVAPASADADLACRPGSDRKARCSSISSRSMSTRRAARPFSLEWHVPSVIELRVYRRGPGTAD